VRAKSKRKQPARRRLNAPVAPPRRERPEKPLLDSVGAQVKALRQAIRLTASQAAHAAGLSIAMFSKIENGRTSASLATLHRIAAALNVPITALFAKYDRKHDATFVRAGHGLVIDRRGTRAGHRYELLGHSIHSSLRVEPFLITLDETSDAFPVFQHPGLEFIYMLSGEVAYRHADRLYRLSPGDSLFFDAEALHGPEELTALPARYLSIIIAPQLPQEKP
jgi:transcriptional regulator with XRE-family HTH domain